MARLLPSFDERGQCLVEKRAEEGTGLFLIDERLRIEIISRRQPAFLANAKYQKWGFCAEFSAHRPATEHSSWERA